MGHVAGRHLIISSRNKAPNIKYSFNKFSFQYPESRGDNVMAEGPMCIFGCVKPSPFGMRMGDEWAKGDDLNRTNGALLD